MRKRAKRDTKRSPTHPGKILRDDVLPYLKISISDAANELGISRQTLHRILSGKLAISPAMALRLGKFCGNGAALWLNLQRTHDLYHAEHEMADELARIKTRKAAA